MDYVKKFLHVERIIGQGAFGKVLVTSGDFINNSNTKFAVKCVHPILRPQRLVNELRHLRDLGGKANVVQMHTAHFSQGSLFIVMDLIEHDRFVDIVAQLDTEEIVMYMKNLLIALDHVHKHGIMHRDIKPANFLYNRKYKKFLLVDFGLAQKVRPRSALFVNRANLPADNSNLITATTTSLTPCQPILPTTPTSTNINNKRLKTPLFTDINQDNKLLGTPKKVNHITAPSLMNSNSPLVNLNSTTTHLIVQNPSRHYISITPKGSPITPNVPTKRQLDEAPNSNEVNSMLKKLRVSNNIDEIKEPVKLTVGAYESPVTHDDSLMMDRRTNYQHAKFSTPTVPIRRTNQSARCACRGKPRTCSTCTSRPDSHAPKSGTPGYKSPEVLLRYPNQTTAVDIWSAGCILACLLCGHAPFFRDVEDSMSLAEIITLFGSQRVISAAKALGIRLIIDPPRDPVNLKDLCIRIRSNPDKRQISLPDSLYELLDRMLDPNPITRITASEALSLPCFNDD